MFVCAFSGWAIGQVGAVHFGGSDKQANDQGTSLQWHLDLRYGQIECDSPCWGWASLRVDHEFIYQSADKNVVLYNCMLGLHSTITNKLNTVSRWHAKGAIRLIQMLPAQTNKQIITFHMSTLRTFLLVATREPVSKHTLVSVAHCLLHTAIVKCLLCRAPSMAINHSNISFTTSETGKY